MTTAAVEPSIEPLTFAKLIGIRLIGVTQRPVDGGRSAADSARKHGDVAKFLGGGRVRPKIALLTLASAQKKRGDEDPAPAAHGNLNT
jgi:hypothetical protein